jgi:hypothetical protein
MRYFNPTKILHTVGSGALVGLFALGGCDYEAAELAELTELTDIDQSTELTEEDGEFRAWTRYTSEEDPPLICPNRQVVRGTHCTGSYCDNIALDCVFVGGGFGQHRWLRYFSEEGTGPQRQGHCVGSDEWFSGITCQGSYCDNISMRCTRIPNRRAQNCEWSGWYSEEQPPFIAPAGRYIKAIECDGSYCDNKRYRHCRMV